MTMKEIDRSKQQYINARNKHKRLKRNEEMQTTEEQKLGHRESLVLTPSLRIGQSIQTDRERHAKR